MDIEHTYEIEAQTQWTYKLECTYELWCTNRDSKRNKAIQEDSNKQKLIAHCLNIDFQSFLNFDKQTQTQIQKKIDKLKERQIDSSNKRKHRLKNTKQIDSLRVKQMDLQWGTTIR
jgi:hypothetical protein